MHLRRIWIALTVCVVYAGLASQGYAFQRMGVPPGTSVMIPGNGAEELPALCLDQDGVAATTANSFVRVLNSESPGAVVVETDKKSMSLEEAIREGIVRVSGVAEPHDPEESVYDRFDAVQVNNLTDGPVNVRVKYAMALGGKGGGAGGALAMPFRYDVTQLLRVGENQNTVWNKIADCKAKAEAQGRELSSDLRDKLMDSCIRQVTTPTAF